MTGYLCMFIGPMFAGKSTKLLQEARKYTNNERLLVKHSSDNRYVKDNNTNYISTHDGTYIPCQSYNRLFDFNNNNLDNLKNENIKAIFIDEGQFFEDLYDIVLILVNKYNKDVYISGLDGDYKREPFSQILQLIPEADTVSKINAKCYKCERNAPFTSRLVEIKGKVVIGGSDKYQPSCREHHVIV